MHLAIGDVMRVRRDGTVGTVAGIVKSELGALIHLDMGHGASRVARPEELERLARSSMPMTTARHIVTVALFVVGIVVGALTSAAVHGDGGHWLLALFTAYCTTATVTGVLVTTAHRPRTVRV